MNNNKRIYSLDFIRSFAMLMGLVIHAPIVFMIEDITDVKFVFFDSNIVNIIVGWIHMWRMPLFFLISGFFSQMILEKKGVVYFLKDRFTRIFLTMIVFSSLVSFIFGEKLGNLYQFWFLYYLFFISIFNLITFKKLNKIIYYFSFSFIVNSKLPFIVILFLLLSYLTSKARPDGYQAIIPSHFLETNFLSILYYFNWYLVGQIIYKNQNLLSFFGKKSVFLLFVIATTSSFLINNKITNFIPISIISLISTLSWIFFVISIGNIFFNKERKIINFFVELSYPVFIFHLVPCIFFGVVMYEMGFSDLEMMLPNIFLSGISSIILYFVFVKYTPLNWIINGYNKSIINLKKKNKKKI